MNGKRVAISHPVKQLRNRGQQIWRYMQNKFRHYSVDGSARPKWWVHELRPSKYMTWLNLMGMNFLCYIMYVWAHGPR